MVLFPDVRLNQGTAKSLIKPKMKLIQNRIKNFQDPFHKLNNAADIRPKPTNFYLIKHLLPDINLLSPLWRCSC